MAINLPSSLYSNLVLVSVSALYPLAKKFSRPYPDKTTPKYRA
jgi:hypothetical protein